jgi:hypothetical protein
MADNLCTGFAEIEAFGDVDPVDIELKISSFYPEMRTIVVPCQPSVWFNPLSQTQRQRNRRHVGHDPSRRHGIITSTGRVGR